MPISKGGDVMFMVESPQSGCAWSARRVLVIVAPLFGVLAAAPVAAGASGLAGAASATSSIKLFPLPYTLISRGRVSLRLSDTPVKMVVGPDGALWFTDVHYRADESVVMRSVGYPHPARSACSRCRVTPSPSTRSRQAMTARSGLPPTTSVTRSLASTHHRKSSSESRRPARSAKYPA
jgi:hypothetical protein